MAIIIKQLSPSAATWSTLYEVPAATSTVCSSILVCNRSAATTTFSIVIRPSVDSLADKHYIYPSVTINGNDTFAATVGITLPTGYLVSVYATLNTLSFNLFGQENS